MVNFVIILKLWNLSINRFPKRILVEPGSMSTAVVFHTDCVCVIRSPWIGYYWRSYARGAIPSHTSNFPLLCFFFFFFSHPFSIFRISIILSFSSFERLNANRIYSYILYGYLHVLCINPISIQVIALHLWCDARTKLCSQCSLFTVHCSRFAGSQPLTVPVHRKMFTVLNIFTCLSCDEPN